MYLHLKQHKKHESDLLVYSSSEGVTGAGPQSLPASVLWGHPEARAGLPLVTQPRCWPLIGRGWPVVHWLCISLLYQPAVASDQRAAVKHPDMRHQHWDRGVMQQNWPETTNSGMLAPIFLHVFSENGFKLLLPNQLWWCILIQSKEIWKSNKINVHFDGNEVWKNDPFYIQSLFSTFLLIFHFWWKLDEMFGKVKSRVWFLLYWWDLTCKLFIRLHTIIVHQTSRLKAFSG